MYLDWSRLLVTSEALACAWTSWLKTSCHCQSVCSSDARPGLRAASQAQSLLYIALSLNFASAFATGGSVAAITAA
eukprot:1158756-Pelagomonas_calceolata.AAC.6